ncbi:ABC-2 type transport system permease protein [Friedmanniella endophytica]|uniref:ABC-2 type transport system permease protein n=1 Tax=Microlunatus kandeliicorticis TaxID=1759536 RepID=A0A7W3IQ19_9ACTN|nr:hypothetical protein [Microlunatus kandeliicorticis]MBA8793147.1 ABC-2 type transport system permease protein [Microlunatus kandeliicorticis]
MVALVVGLKLTLLRNGLRRSVWRTVGLIIGMLYGLGLVVGALAGLIALRWTSTVFTADLTVVVFSIITVGWMALSVLVFGVDETVDPGKFALLPVPARKLQPGMFLAGLVGTPGIATTLIVIGLVITWARDVPLALAALLAAPLGLATCFLLARTATSAFSQALASRRFRDFAAVALALFGAVIGITANLIGNYSGFHPDQMRGLLARAATVLGWTPFGWAWSVPAAVARGDWLGAVARLVLAAALVVALWLAWRRFLERSLTSPLTGGGGGGRQVRAGTLVERLFPATPAGAVATRAMRYWRRDPRYLASLGGICVAPIVVVVTQLANPHRTQALIVFAPILITLFLGSIVASDISYDGSALWTHISTGLRGADDRWGRVMSTTLVILPISLVMIIATTAITGELGQLPRVLALLVVMALSGLGVGSWIGAIWQTPAPPPGASPFAKNEGGGAAALILFGATTGLTLVCALPTVALVVGSVWLPWLAWVALLVALVTGVLALRAGVRLGGTRLDRHWPDVLTAVTAKS